MRISDQLGTVPTRSGRKCDETDTRRQPARQRRALAGTPTRSAFVIHVSQRSLQDTTAGGHHGGGALGGNNGTPAAMTGALMSEYADMSSVFAAYSHFSSLYISQLQAAITAAPRYGDITTFTSKW